MAGDLPCFPLSSECHFKNRNHFNWDLVFCTFFSYGVGVVWSRLPLGSGPCLAGRKEVNAFLKLCISSEKIKYCLPPATSTTLLLNDLSWFQISEENETKREKQSRESAEEAHDTREVDKEAEFPHKTKISNDNVKYHLFDCVKDLRNLKRIKMVPHFFP